MNRILEPVRYLERDDKHSLGAGEGVLFAPPFPEHLDAPGFWDSFQLHWRTLAPGFTWTLLDGASRLPLRLRPKRREWTPARLRTTFESERGVAVAERKGVHAHDALVSRVTVRNLSPRGFDLIWVLWTALEVDTERGVAELRADSGRWILSLLDHRAESSTLGWALGARGAPTSLSAQLCEARPPSATGSLPRWNETPFRDAIRTGGRLNDSVRQGSPHAHGRLYLALSARASIAPGEVEVLDGVLALGSSVLAARTGLDATLALDDPLQDADRAWRAFFDEVPRVECDDARLASCYWHRWYALRLHSFSRLSGAYRYPAVCLGGSELRHLDSAAAPIAAREMRWHPDGRHARGSLLNFIEHQREDGAFPGEIRPDGATGWPGPPGDWGGALIDVLSMHEDAAFLEAAHAALARHARWLEGARRGEDIASLVYRLRLLSALGATARRQGCEEEAASWEAEARRVGQAELAARWCWTSGLFLDPVGAVDSPHCGSKGDGATGFLPWLTDLVQPEQDESMLRSLRDPGRFWTPYPLPSLSASAPGFDPDGVVDGVRRMAPRNGRVWPEQSSAVAEGLFALAARRPEAEETAGAFFWRLLDLLCRDGDPRRPTAFEHYHPTTGTPSDERGLDDTLRSWLVDLILKHAAGIQPRLDGVAFAPRSLGLRELHVSGVVIRGSSYEARIEGQRATLRRDGKVVETRKL